MNRILIASTFLVACGFHMNTGGEYLVYVDPSFTSDRQGEIRTAIAEWNRVAEGNIHMVETVSPDGSHVIQIWANHNLHAQHKAGECTPFTETIEIQDDMKEDLTRRTTLHELGHAFGMGHDEEGTIMCKSLGCSPEHLTCEDIWQFCQIWKCDADHMAVCKTR